MNYCYKSYDILAYADTKNGCHVCLNCVEEHEKEKFYPMNYNDLWEYKYVDYEMGYTDSPNPPSCDRCLEEITFGE